MTQNAPESPSPSALCLLCGASNDPSFVACRSCGSPLPQAAAAFALDSGDLVGFARALTPGTVLRGGDYRVLGILGQGGFGITYRASNERLGREVAIKEFFPATCEREGRDVHASGGLSTLDFASLKSAFLEEARVLARFELPSVVRVFGAWEENASAYMEMELLRGPTLAQVLEERDKLPVEETMRLFAPVLDALERVHHEGWLHRDIKPQNLIFEPHLATYANTRPKTMDLAACRAVLLDFGAAKKVAANTSQAFSVIVTPGYAPLEQYATRAKRGPFTDVYALCATMYHALGGQAPAPASDRALHDDLIGLRELRPEVPPVVARAIEAGLRIEIARRPQTIAELRQLLSNPLPAGAMPVSLPVGPGIRPSAGQLSARQQSRLHSIHSANTDAGQTPDAQLSRQVLASHLPLNTFYPPTGPPTNAPASAQSAQQAANNAAGSQPSPPLPQSRPTTPYSPPRPPGHMHRKPPTNSGAPDSWNNGTYLVAMGIIFVTIGPLLAILNAILSAHPHMPPAPWMVPRMAPVPIEITPPHIPHIPARSARPLAQPVISYPNIDRPEESPLSPDGRSVCNIMSDGTMEVWDVATQRPVLTVSEEPGAPEPSLSRIKWSGDGKYLLVLSGASMMPPAGGSHASRFQTVARLFDVPKRRLLWQKPLVSHDPFSSGPVSWDLKHGSVWLGWNSSLRRLSLLSGEENTPSGALATDTARSQTKLKGGSVLASKVFFEAPFWLQEESAPSSPEGASSHELVFGELGSREASRHSLPRGSSAKYSMSYPMLISLRGRWLAQIGSTAKEGRVRFVSFNGDVIREWRGNAKDDESASFIGAAASPDGRMVAHLRFRNLLRVWNIQSGEDRAIRFAEPRPSETSVEMSGWAATLCSNDSGSRWLIIDPQRPLLLCDASRGTMRAAPGVRATHAVFSSDGSRVSWFNLFSRKMGWLNLSEFSRRVRIQKVDAPSSRPVALAP